LPLADGCVLVLLAVRCCHQPQPTLRGFAEWQTLKSQTRFARTQKAADTA